MKFIVGITLALFICGAAAGLGMDRERVFHPAVLMAAATYYVLFAVIDGRREVLWPEMAIAAVFIGFAVAGFKRSPWLVVVALVAHGVIDVFHDALVRNAGVRSGCTGFCMTSDVTAAVLVACVLAHRARGEGNFAGLGRH